MSNLLCGIAVVFGVVCVLFGLGKVAEAFPELVVVIGILSICFLVGALYRDKL